eukprot:scaffold2844_cov71-Phaeocystis_antarctica.AAC.3
MRVDVRDDLEVIGVERGDRAAEEEDLVLHRVHLHEVDVRRVALVRLWRGRDHEQRPLDTLQVRALPRLDADLSQLLDLARLDVEVVLLDEAVEQVVRCVGGAEPHEGEHVRKVEVAPQPARLVLVVEVRPRHGTAVDQRVAPPVGLEVEKRWRGGGEEVEVE